MVLDPFLTVPDILNMWILSLLCQGSFVLNFVLIRNIHFIIVFLLNDIIDILFYLSNTYVLYLSGIVRSNAGEWWRENKLIWWTSYSYFGLPFCNESHPKIQDSNIKLTPKHIFIPSLSLFSYHQSPAFDLKIPERYKT